MATGETELTSKNWLENRSSVRQKSLKGRCVRSSLQTLDKEDVFLLLESDIQRSKEASQNSSKAHSFRAVLEHLAFGLGFLPFKEAFRLYSSFFDLHIRDKQTFRDKLLDNDQGLPVYVITQHITVPQRYYLLFMLF